MVVVRGGCVCVWVGGWWEGGATLFLHNRGWVRTNLFLFWRGVLSKFLLDNSSFSAPTPPPPDNYCTVPYITTFFTGPRERYLSKMATTNEMYFFYRRLWHLLGTTESICHWHFNILFSSFKIFLTIVILIISFSTWYLRLSEQDIFFSNKKFRIIRFFCWLTLRIKVILES